MCLVCLHVGVVVVAALWVMLWCVRVVVNDLDDVLASSKPAEQVSRRRVGSLTPWPHKCCNVDAGAKLLHDMHSLLSAAHGFGVWGGRREEIGFFVLQEISRMFSCCGQFLGLIANSS